MLSLLIRDLLDFDIKMLPSMQLGALLKNAKEMASLKMVPNNK
jgi:hypothetical protein